MKKFWKIAAIVCGAVLLVVIALQTVLNRPFVSRTIDKYAAEYIDGKFDYSGLRFSTFKCFPKLKVSVDSISITYPHERYSAYDKSSVRSRLLVAGRGEISDTLVSIPHFSASVNPLKILFGRIRLNDAVIEDLSLYAHKFGTTANWMLFKSGEPDTLKKEAGTLPWISIGRIAIDNPRIIYTDQFDTVFLAAKFDQFRLRGDIKADVPDGIYKFRNAAVKLNSLKARGRLPYDTLSIDLDHLEIRNPFRQVLDIDMEAKATGFTSFGRIAVPLRLNANLELKQGPGSTRVDIPSLDANLAYIPLSAHGKVIRREEGTEMNLHAAIEKCNLANVVEGFATSLPLLTSRFDTDAILSVEVDADGVLSESSVPKVDARVKIPDSHVYYGPLDILASIGLDASGSLSSNKKLQAVVRRIAVRSSGVDLSANGKADNLLGKSPLFDVHAAGYAIADSLLRYLKTDKAIYAGGKVSVNLDANTSLKEINELKFHDSVISGDVSGDSLFFSVPEDSLDAVVGAPVIRLRSNPEGLVLAADFKKAFINKGDSLHVRVRDMKNAFRMFMTENRGEAVPKLSFETENKSIYLKSGPHRFGLSDMTAGASIQMRPIRQNQLRKHFIDSLHRAHPGVSVDSLLLIAAEERHYQLPDYLKPNELSQYDVSIKLDSTLSRYFSIWKPAGNIKVGKGFISTPVYPLRTRISALSLDFTDNNINLDTLKVVSGMSDVMMKGKVRGLRRALMTKGMIRADFDVKANRFNVNELVTALDKGKRTKDVDTDTLTEGEGSYLVDSIADAKLIKQEVPLIVIPGNLDVNVDAGVEHFKIADVDIEPVSAHLRLKDRTAQLTEGKAFTSFGRLGMNAFYSTQSKKDITLGADMRLNDISAEGIIHMLPNVDKMMPALKSFEGDLNMDLSITSSLDSNMNVIMPTVEGIMRIGGKNLNISDAGNLRKITRLLLFKDKNIGRINDMYVDAVVHDCKLEVFPFELAVDRYKVVLRGTQGLDKEMNYHMSIIKTPFLIPFGINIYGYTDNWRFLIGPPKYREGKIPAYTKQLDTVQINILQSIKDVYNKGIENVRKASKSSVNLAEASSTADYGTDYYNQDGEVDMEKLDSLSFAMAMAMEDAELEAETEKALESHPLDVQSIILEYQTTHQDAFIERRIRQLKKKTK